MGSQYSALDFEFLYVKDLTEKDALSSIVTSEDNLPKMNVWMLQDTEKIDLLRSVLRPDHLEYMGALIVLDLDQPHEMMNSLNRWMSLLDELIRPILSQVTVGRQDEIRRRIATHILNYERVDQSGKKEEEKKLGKEKDEDQSNQ